MRRLLQITILLLATAVARASTIRVPADYPSLRAAMNEATDGDTILVAPGTYSGPDNKDLDFRGKNLVVRSESGSRFTTLDCEGDGRAFLLQGGEHGVIDGFHITRGYVGRSPASGAAIYCYSSIVTIRSCEVTQCRASWDGGAIFANGSRCYIFDGTLANNISGSDGAAIYTAGGGTLHVEHTNIIANTSYDDGGAIVATSDTVTTVGCTISDNVASFRRGGIHCSNANVNIQNCTITRNRSITNYTGGVSLSACVGRVESSVIDGNFTDDYGAGLGIYGSDIVMQSCQITNNITGSGGGAGGLNVVNAALVMRNCVISGNISDKSLDVGAGINCTSSAVELTNCVVYGNRGIQEGAIYSIDSTPVVTSSVIWGNTPDNVTGDSPTINYSDIEKGWIGGVGNIALEPAFVDPNSGDFHLAAWSPCIDSGEPLEQECLPPGLGTPRPDMGAYGGGTNCTWLAYPVLLSMNPEDATVARGDTLSWESTFVNASPTTQVFDAWFSALLLDGRETVFAGPAQGSMAPYTSATVPWDAIVPQGLPLGSGYEVRTNLGEFPDVAAHAALEVTLIARPSP